MTLLTPDFPPQKGGIQRILHELSLLFSPVVITLRSPGWKEFDLSSGIKTVRIPKIPSLPRKLHLPLFLVYSFPHRSELTIAGHILTAPCGWMLKKLYGIPYIIYTYALEIMDKRYKKIFSFLMRHADRIIALSEYPKEYMIKELGVDEGKIEKVYPPVDVKRFNPRVDGRKIREKYGLSGKLVLTTIARMDARQGHKGQDVVIELMPEIIKKFPDALYLLVGDGDDRPRLESLAENLGVRKHVVFTGFIPHEEIHEVMGATDVYIMLSREIKREKTVAVEGFGVVYAEASACGKPVIGSKKGGAREPVVHGKTGLLVDPEDKKEVLSAIFTLLENERLREKMGREGRKRAEREFSREVYKERLEKIFESVLHEGSRPYRN